MSTTFSDLLPDWALNPTVRAESLRTARALLKLSKGEIPVAPMTLRRYEDEEVTDVEPALLHTLIAWYERQGVAFGIAADGGALVRRTANA